MHDVPGRRLPGARRPGSVWRPRAPGAARGGQTACASVAAVVAACDSQVRSQRLPLRVSWRAGGGGETGGPRLWGTVPVGGASQAAGPCPPSLLAVRGPAHWVPGHRSCLRPWFPLLPASPLSCCAVPRGGRAVGLLGALHPPSAAAGGLAFVGARGGGPGERSVVSGQQVRGTPLPRVRASRAAGVRPPVRRPCPCVCGLRGFQDRGVRISPSCPAPRTAEGGGGMVWYGMPYGIGSG